jgi:Protein of unknown function (DUF3040)
MSLSAWEQQALDSIKKELTGSDPELTALISAFNRLASDMEMPEREHIRASSRWALRRPHRARRRFSLRRPLQRLGRQRATLMLWLLATAALIAGVTLALNVGGNHATCPETVVTICTGPTFAHSPGSPSHEATTSQVPRQPVGIPQTGP